MKNYTIRDVAKRAGVSHMTVSRVINNNPKVLEATREKVLKVIEEMDFKPDALARAFASKKSYLLGLVVADVRNPFYSEMSRGIEDKALEMNYSVICCSSDEATQRTESCVENLLKAGVDGIIFTSVRQKEPVVEKLIQQKFPVVLLNRTMKNASCHSVTCNNSLGAYQIASHLIQNGYKKIAMITGQSYFSTSSERVDGYLKALREHNLQENSDYIIYTSFTSEGGYEGALKLLEMQEKPDAIMCGNDFIAMGVMDALAEAKLSIPNDIAITGFDDTSFSALTQIALTTVSQQKYEMGNLGVQILIDTIERKNLDYVHNVVLNPQLVIRRSCGTQ